MSENLNNEIRSLKMQIAKLQLESKLRRNLASELDKQKQIAKNAEELANEKSKEIEEIASQLSKYLSPQLYDSIFSGEKKVSIESRINNTKPIYFHNTRNISLEVDEV